MKKIPVEWIAVLGIIIALYVGSTVLAQPDTKYKLYNKELSQLAKSTIVQLKYNDVRVTHVIETDDGYDILGRQGGENLIVFIVAGECDLDTMTPRELQYYLSIMDN